MPIAPERAQDIGDRVVVADAVCKIDDTERVMAKSGNRIDLVAGVDRDGQTRAVVNDVDMSGARLLEMKMAVKQPPCSPKV